MTAATRTRPSRERCGTGLDKSRPCIHRVIKSKVHPTPPDNFGGQVLTPGPGNPLLSPANDCGGPLAAGVLPAAGGTLSGDTYLAGDDFEGSLFPVCGYSYGPSGNDEIWEFNVESGGRWTFDTCTAAAGWDTSIGITYDSGDGCPGVGLICNGDDSCGSYLESAIRDVCLQAGTTYWLIVDGWSPAVYFPGTYYDVSYARTVDPCSSDAECSDGDACTGIEQCIDGCCENGPSACPPWAQCDQDTQLCVNVQDPCTAALNGFNSQWTATQDCESDPDGGCEMFWKCDDVETWEGSGNKLISYRTLFQARDYWDGQCASLGDTFTYETAIFTNSVGGECLPLAEIPGTRCTFEGVVTGVGDPPQEALCEPGDGMQSGVVLPDRSGDTANCEIDFFVCQRSEILSGFKIAGDGQEIVGGPAGADDFGGDVVMVEGNEPDACANGVFSVSWFGGNPPADFANLHVCVEPVGVCCYAAGGCDVVAEKDCVDGAYRGDNVLDDIQDCNSALGDPDGDNFWYECDNCPSTSNPGQEDCNDDGEGDACDPDPGEGDKDGDGCCDHADACPNDPRKCAESGQCGCGEEEIDSDGDGCNDCVDECPDDPTTCEAGICGCGATANDREDNDGDGVLNCVDQCPGIDDNVFAPDCKGNIPTVSEWGLVILALLLLVAGKVYFGRPTAIA